MSIPNRDNQQLNITMATKTQSEMYEIRRMKYLKKTQFPWQPNKNLLRADIRAQPGLRIS
jgi:hypothetical protein